jgi:hypothetical protein
MTISSGLKKLFIATTGAAILALGIGQTAQATVLTFDNLPPTSSFDGSLIPDSYGGFSWNNFYYLTTPTYYLTETGYQKGTVSGRNAAYNGYGNIAKVNNSVFDFNGAYLTAAWNDSLFILVEGFLGGAQKYSNLVTVDTTAPTYFNFNFLGIDRLRFMPFGGTNVDSRGQGAQFVMDDFSFNQRISIPEPTPTFGVLAFAALGVGFLVKRKRQ